MPQGPLKEEEHTIEVGNPSAPNPQLVLIIVAKFKFYFSTILKKKIGTSKN